MFERLRELINSPSTSMVTHTQNVDIKFQTWGSDRWIMLKDIEQAIMKAKEFKIPDIAQAEFKHTSNFVEDSERDGHMEDYWRFEFTWKTPV